MQDLKNKVILVTGASDGIGKFTAATLAKQGHKLIIHGRNRQKTEAALAEIKRQSGNPDVAMFLADFLPLAGVKAFADAIKEKYDHIDVLINNAGAQFTEQREVTSEGHEKTMAINVFAPMLLTKLLMPLLVKSESARVVTVASDAHRMAGKPDLDDIELKQGYHMAKAYSLSKLYVIWVMHHFIGETKKAGIHNVTFNLVHPASTRTNLGREAVKSWKWKIIFFLWQIMLVSMDKAASSTLYAATAPELEGVSGRYFGPKGEEQPSAKYHSPENEQKVWDYALNAIRPYLPAGAQS
ncbi:SDR family NAD(P)-dependent oxidoreductase [Xylella fastidiosa]|uniref:SDR family NAD(P)-dependent oxidoreductase n=1 Tax=Xylella fastidiosa TaxID=2371 RepID=UPI0007659222|nr:SDR family NAD(P)-dependent oxidoreductase [Xylella fastidiosa]ALR02890.1 ketoreductase [Xylella fastidiosa]KXB11935.1 ketoreductase [Xylella fastidiosa]KXB22744.1 ketoreductase [Xylella fastidiosa]MDG5823141.1 SDR family NAD(P)-dependent oxidoreductase [Xylella fastidiosa subsp. pauca]MDG5826411.1 SDR family NAD(P)-dependent oxidoreductase [Xylella fastidiosa subsp. pauca]